MAVMKDGIVIPKLKRVQNPKGGRPTLYYSGMGEDYLEYVKAGFEHKEILHAWDLPQTQFDGFVKTRGEMYAPVMEAEKILDKRRGTSMGDEDAIPADEPHDYDGQLEKGEVEAIQRLRNIVKFGKSESAQVQAARELLDRRRGKPVQETQVTGAVTYEIVANIPAPPNSMLIENAPIDITPVEEDEPDEDGDDDHSEPRLPWDRSYTVDDDA